MTTEEQAAQAAAEAEAKKAAEEAARKAEEEKRSADPAIIQAKLDRSIAEEKKLRERAQKLEAEAAKRAAEDEEKAKKLLEEQGKHKELYESEAKKAKDLAERVAKYEAAQRQRADAALSQIPEHLRAFAPQDPEKAEEYAQQIRQSLTPGAPPPKPPPPGSAPIAPPPPPAPGGPKPEKFTVIDAQRSGVTRDPKEKAELAAKERAWMTHVRQHPEDA